MPTPVSQKVTMQNAAAATGNGTALIVADRASVTLQITGTFVGTITIEGTVDDTNWVALACMNLNTRAVATTATAPAILNTLAAGLSQIRARVSAFTSGTITVTGIATSAAVIVMPLTTDLEIGGVAPQLDDTDKLAVSLYGKGSAAGDTAVATTSAGAQIVAAGASTNLDGDGQAQTVIGLRSDQGTEHFVGIANYLYNGSSGWNRQRNNVEATLLASAARTADTQSPDQTNYNHLGLVLFVNVTSITDTPSLTPQLYAKDPVSGSYRMIWQAAAAITATAIKAYLFHPGGAAGSYDEAVNIAIPRTWLVKIVHADTDSATYSVGAAMLP